MTFTVSGLLHDIAVTLIKGQQIYVITPWFTLMGVAMVATSGLEINYQQRPWLIRALINLMIIITCYGASRGLMSLI
ncbi:hypothetical protein [Thalassotalea maritima]|uniref:hypothetical protein n=1 Tax=Thalassotalea maritima TaxID=3242416 RepID=UPI003527CD7D